MSKAKAIKNVDEFLSSDEEQPKKKVVAKVQKKKVEESDDSSEESVDFTKAKTARKESNTNTKTAKKAAPVKKVASDSDDESSEEAKPVAKKAPVVAAPAKKAPAKKVASDTDESSEEAKPVAKKAAVVAAPAKKAPVKKVASDSDDESSEEVKPVAKKAPVVAAPAKKAPAKKAESDSDDESSEEAKPVAKKAAPKKAESDDEEEVLFVAPEKKAFVKPVVANSGCTELFVKNLPWKADENVLYDFFGKYGTVNNVKVLYDKTTGKARGLAFVEFSTREEAQSALDNAANLDIEGRNLQVSFSDQKDENRTAGFNANNGGFNRSNNTGGYQKKFFDGEKHTAFVGNLGFNTNEASVNSFFSDCGNVVDVRVAKQPDGKSKGYCHVDFDSAEGLAKAMAKAGQNLDGRDIRVDASTPRAGGSFRGGDRGGRGGDRGGRGGFRGGRN